MKRAPGGGRPAVTVVLGEPLRCRDVAAVAAGAGVRLGPEARAALVAGLERYEALDGPDPIAHLEDWLVGQRALAATEAERVRAFVRGHCAGVGPLLPEGQVRALMFCRAAVLARGLSGVRPDAVERLLAMLEAGVHPCVPSQGSVGAAGDLAPLAHVAEVAAGYGGRADTPRGRLPGPEAVAPLGPFRPTAKEALALINGATLSVALGALAVHRARRLVETAEVALALSMEAARASTALADAALLAARGHPGGEAVGRRLRELLAGGGLAHARRRPDAFSLRCAPAVLGAARDALDHVEAVVTRELNGACDNPLVLPGAGRVEGGNFHGAPVALAMDHLKSALSQVASAAERRVFRLTYGELSDCLPSFLVASTGLNSGFMLAQYTAASLVSECKGLSYPAGVDSVPTGQHHEDHVSMAPIAARTALEVVEAVAEVVAIELLVAAQAVELRLAAGGGGSIDPRDGPPPISAPRLAAVRARIRKEVPHWTEDRVLHRDQGVVAALVRSGAVLAAAGLEDGEVPGAW